MRAAITADRDVREKKKGRQMMAYWEWWKLASVLPEMASPVMEHEREGERKDMLEYRKKSGNQLISYEPKHSAWAA